MDNQYGYYELEYHQTKQGILEQEYIDYMCKQWSNEDDEKRRLMRIRKIKRIINE